MVASFTVGRTDDREKPFAALASCATTAAAEAAAAAASLGRRAVNWRELEAAATAAAGPSRPLSGCAAGAARRATEPPGVAASASSERGYAMPELLLAALLWLNDASRGRATLMPVSS